MCPKCEGAGEYYYPNTTTWRSRPGMLAGQTFTWGICDLCWGTGDEKNPGENLREKESLQVTKGF